VLPPALARSVGTVETALAHLGMAGPEPGNPLEPLTGVGIGTTAYRGRVCRAESADEALELLEPGDVLVVRATSPAFNSVLSIAGAVVTTDGGPMSHAAVLARELGIPAVIGARGALELAHGTEVDVDPVAGTVHPC
jgi:phosphohistidine swiveling domain-containing protein